MKLKGGQMVIDENKFPIPFTYAFPMGEKDGTQMLIGCNFIRAMQGGLRIEGQTVTFYKNVTTITTKMDTVVAAESAIDELDLAESDYLEIKEAVVFNCGDELPWFKRQFKNLLDRLKEQGFIGENPLRHWLKNQVTCKLDIINPDLTIQDKPLKHVTPAMKEQFDRHVNALLKIGVIRPSTSRHRTMAIMVNSGTSIDPITKKEVKGKERMVFNYRTLNDNTHKDQYSLPGINTILKKVGNSKIFSKFDLKSGFHQVAMESESIPWTAFIVPGGLYEWLVMPFGLKNAPAIFQRKMDNCFRGTEAYIAVYIDDILVFSENETEHVKHLEKMLEICEKWGLVLSPTKMKIAVQEIEFLGAVINRGRIKLQPHIIKKIVQFDEAKLKEKAGLRSWLGILNYARNHIPKLGTLLGPLYSKTSPHGDKRLKDSDYELIRKIKELVQNLPNLELPPPNTYIILEVDGCMEGWGGVCKWKIAKNDPRSTERVCAYASGKFPVIKSTIDAEIHACMETLKALKIHYLDQSEITLRTDCQAIISFYNKSAQNKPSRMESLKQHHLLKVRKAISLAELWIDRSGETESPGFLTYANTIDDILMWREDPSISFQEMLNRTASGQDARNIRRNLFEILQKQKTEVCTQLQILVAMNFLHKAKLEAHATSDNWARDCLGIVNANIQELVRCHNTLQRHHQENYY